MMDTYLEALFAYIIDIDDFSKFTDKHPQVLEQIAYIHDVDLSMCSTYEILCDISDFDSFTNPMGLYLLMLDDLTKCMIKSIYTNDDLKMLDEALDDFIENSTTAPISKTCDDNFGLPYDPS